VHRCTEEEVCYKHSEVLSREDYNTQVKILFLTAVSMFARRECIHELKKKFATNIQKFCPEKTITRE
jgi:hypothetical protein